MPSIKDSEIKNIYKLSKESFLALKRLNLNTFEDILKYFPVRYTYYGDNKNIANLKEGEYSTLYGYLKKIQVRKSFKTKIPMTEAIFTDGVNNIKVFWFNQPYIAKIYKENTLVSLKGIPQSRNNILYFSNPIIEEIKEIPEQSGSLFSNLNNKDNLLVPIYRESKGITSNIIYEIIKRIIKSKEFQNIQDPLPEEIRSKLNLPHLKEAFIYIHIPKEEKMFIAAKKRFLFEEMFYIQLKILKEKKLLKESLAYKINKPEDLNNFISKFNFVPNNTQLKIIKDILNDLNKNTPMQRLLEGDVGSGKTFIASAAIYATIKSKKDNKEIGTPLQVAYLAPTEILAYQQFENFVKIFKDTGIAIGYLSSKKCLKYPSKIKDEVTKISKSQLIKWIKEGAISLLVGTHAITKKNILFKDLATIVIDEQHRFGVEVRKELAHKKGDLRNEIPHLLSMTATPIPRTLALTLFGDLDLSVLDEMPKDRKKVITKLCFEKDRNEIYEIVKKEVLSGGQVYIICSRINESDDPNDNKRNVEQEVRNLKKIFKDINIAPMHSKLKETEKEKIIQDFKNNKIKILVSTSVIEVGINIPNANVIIIENADRFGLAQLHQLRGRVGRSDKQAYCYIFTSSENEKSLKRLKTFTEIENGFELAENDLKERGPGSLLSKNQSGLSDLGMEALKNLKLVEIAKEEAKKILEKDFELNNYPLIKEKIYNMDKVHME